MAITATTLSAALTANDLTMAVASGTGFPGVGTIANPAYLVRVDTEYMLAVSQPVTNTIKLAFRGYDGTAAVAHDILAKVEVSATRSDFPPVPAGSTTELPGYTPIQITIGQDKTFTAAEILGYGNRSVIFALTKASAAAIVLVAPSKSQDGLTLYWTNLTAAAHVITATGLLSDGVTGGGKNTATFAAFVGSSLTLQAQNGLWNIMAAVVCPIT